MTPTELLIEARRLGIALVPKGEKLRIEAPNGVLTAELRQALAEHKREILVHLRRRSELIDLPWPVGYGGLPVGEVARAEAQNDRLGITDPVHRRLNVLTWLWGHFRDAGDTEMAWQMKETYHELRHADPSIRDICGLCEYKGDGG